MRSGSTFGRRNRRITREFVLPIAVLVFAGCQTDSLPTEPTGPGESGPERATWQARSVTGEDWIVVFKPGTADPPGLARKLAADHDGSVR